MQGVIPGPLWPKVLKGGNLGDYVGDYYRGLLGGILGV